MNTPQQNQTPDQDVTRAKQAISPNGLENQSAEGNSGPAAEIDAPELPADAMEDEYMNGDQPAENVPMSHPNRNRDDKADLDKPAYS